MLWTLGTPLWPLASIRIQRKARKRSEDPPGPIVLVTTRDSTLAIFRVRDGSCVILQSEALRAVRCTLYAVTHCVSCSKPFPPQSSRSRGGGASKAFGRSSDLLKIQIGRANKEEQGTKQKQKEYSCKPPILSNPRSARIRAVVRIPVCRERLTRWIRVRDLRRMRNQMKRDPSSVICRACRDQRVKGSKAGQGQRHIEHNEPSSGIFPRSVHLDGSLDDLAVTPPSSRIRLLPMLGDRMGRSIDPPWERVSLISDTYIGRITDHGKRQA
jgi:hypothetical protein